MTVRVAIMAAPRAATPHPIVHVLRSLADHEPDIPLEDIGVFADTPELPDLGAPRNRRWREIFRTHRAMPYFTRTRSAAELAELRAAGVRFALLTLCEAIEWCCERDFGAVLEDDVSFSGNKPITWGMRWVSQVEAELGGVVLSLHDLYGSREFTDLARPRYKCGDGMVLYEAGERYFANGSQIHLFSAASGRRVAARIREYIAKAPEGWPGPHIPYLDVSWLLAARTLAMPYLITRDCIVMHDNLSNSTWAFEPGGDEATNIFWKEARRTKRFQIL